MKQRKKGSFAWVIIVVAVILLVGGCSACFCSPTKNKTEETQTQVVESKEESKEEPKDFLTVLKENIGDSDFADHVYSVLTNDIGFVNLEYISNKSGTGNYEIKADGVNVVVTAMPANEEETEYIRVFQPDGAVFYEEGQVLMSGEEVRKEVEHYKHTDEYYIIAKNIIKDVVDTSNKMNFAGQIMDADDIGYGWKGDYVVVKSWVDILNNFGSYERFDFIVEFIPTDLNNYQYDVVYVNIGDQQIGTLIEVDSLHIIRY